jgi:hypothetical protein
MQASERASVLKNKHNSPSFNSLLLLSIYSLYKIALDSIQRAAA